MKIQISLLRGLMASSLLWNLPEVFCVYMHIHSLLLPHTLLLVPDYILFQLHGLPGVDMPWVI